MELTLEQARLVNKMSRKCVAEQMKVNEATLYRWEVGKTSLTANQFKRLCDIYGCSMDDILLPSKLTLS